MIKETKLSKKLFFDFKVRAKLLRKAMKPYDSVSARVNV